MHDIAEFLSAHDPFAALGPEELERLAENVEIEYFEAGATIFRQGEGPPDAMWVVRTGAVELRDDGRVLDLLGEGEPFGHPWMLSGLPTGWEARARESSLCYRLAAEDVIPLLSRAGRPALGGQVADGPAAAGRPADRASRDHRRRPGAGAEPGPRAAGGLRAGRSPCARRRPGWSARRSELDPGRPRRRRARDRHRSRPALAGRRRRAAARHPGQRGDDHAGDHRRRRSSRAPS